VKLLVDESVGIKVYFKLKQMGFDVVTPIYSMKGADDEEVMRSAVLENRVIITNDKDFGWLAHLYKPLGVILLRLKDERAENKIKIIQYVLEKYGERIPGNILMKKSVSFYTL
jgi:predicted nuclease of predicted toxin-antitoxin system